MNINTDKVLIFSDIHWGINNDAEYKLINTEKCTDWLIETAKSNGITHLFFLGDWFHNRNAISVKTFHRSYTSLSKMSDEGLHVTLLVGNHDAYFKDTIEVHSLASFDNIKNVTVLSEPTEITLNGHNVLLHPWSENHEIDKTYDLIMGHFEFEGGSFNNVMTCKHGISGAELTKRAPLVFSGHFHLRKEYDYKNGKIVTVGCPLQMDWGDHGDDKGAYILSDDLTYEFVKNTVTPEHVKINFSRLDEDMKTTTIEGNYVKLIVDKALEYSQTVKIQSFIDSKGPGTPCEVEYLVGAKTVHLMDTVEDIDESTFINKRDQLYSYVEYASNDDEDIKELDTEVLKSMLIELYDGVESVSK